MALIYTGYTGVIYRSELCRLALQLHMILTAFPEDK